MTKVTPAASSPSLKKLSLTKVNVGKFGGNMYDDEERDNKCVDIIKKYFIETSIHGLKYIFENKRHFTERIFWIIACCIMWSSGFYLIHQVCLGFFKIIFEHIILKLSIRILKIVGKGCVSELRNVPLNCKHSTKTESVLCFE